MKLHIGYFFIFIIFLSCTKDKTILAPKQDNYNIINFRNLLHSRDFFFNVEENSFITIKSSLELQVFFDTAKSHFHFP